MAEAEQPIIRITTPSRTFQGHDDSIFGITVFPDGRRIVTTSRDQTLRLWNLEDGALLKKMEGHRQAVGKVAISRDGQLIASGDWNGEVIAWNRDGESLTQPIKVHSGPIFCLDFSPDGAVLASGSWDKTTELWSTKTWQVQENPINCGERVHCVRYSPSGEHLAIATDKNIQIWNPNTRECIANFQGHTAFNGARNFSLAWTLDGTRLLSAGNLLDSTIREWDPSTWMQVGEPWKGHVAAARTIVMNPAGTLFASASDDHHVRLWRLSDRRSIAILKHVLRVYDVTFSADGKHILSGGKDMMISKWAVPDDALVDVTPTEPFPQDTLPEDVSKEQVTNDDMDIDTDANDYNSLDNCSFVKARKSDWDGALHDVLKSISIQPSWMGCISKGIALCGNRQIQDAMKAFDLAFMFVDGDLSKTHLLLLIKAIALFNADQHDEAILRVQELATTCPNADTLACGIVETYLHIQLGINALDWGRHNDAADHFTDAVNAISFSSMSDIHSRYDIFVVLFGWDLKSLWQIAYQNWCHTLLLAGRLPEALKAYRYMMDTADEATKVRCLDWSATFKNHCSAAIGDADLAASGDAALTAGDYDRAIELYSAITNLDFATDTVLANRSKARSGKMLWDDALLDAEKVIELNPSSYLGYQLKHAALHGAHRYDEALETFQIMLSKLENAPDTEITNLRQQYVSPPEAEGAIQVTINAHLDNAPHRLFNTFTGRLCNRKAQIYAFRTSPEYKELLSCTTKHTDLQSGRIQDAVAKYFRYVMLSHRWEGTEPLLHNIQGKVVYDLDPVGGIAKLRSFCETARDTGYCWAWIDTCCIDQTNNVELQQSVNSMFSWYRHSALTIVYLSDVPPSSQPGALASSAWNTRGWTVQEFLAPNIVLFYQKDWTLYLDDRSLNHKNSVPMMQEMGDATGIDARALVAFRPGMRGAREKLQWVSKRVTTWQEDIAYSLFGIFRVNLPVIYGEKKQNALGRLLQEVVAQSGDISALNWFGRSSKFNSCLPADITLYETSPRSLPSLPEDEVQRLVSSLQEVEIVKLALRLYQNLDCLSAPRFANRRLHLPCITFLVTTVKRRRDEDQETYFTYDVQADGVHDLLITTEDKLMPFSTTPPAWQTILLVRPWDRCLLELPDFADNIQSVGDWTPPGSPSQDSPSISHIEHGLVDSEFNSRALRLILRLGQPFSAFLLARQRDGEYKRIASDHDIIAQVKDVHGMMDIRTLEIL